MSDQIDAESDTRSRRTKTSWIWQHFKEEEIEQNGKLISVIKCQEKSDDGNPCKAVYQNSGSSTGNAINHLRISHNLSKGGAVVANKNRWARTQARNLTPEGQQLLRQLLVNWIINDLQPIHVIRSPDLRKLLNELNPDFVIPSQETIKGMIYEAFNHTLPQLRNLIKNEAMSVSLTLDLWTSKSRQGYLGVTCSFIDSEWKLKEFILAIEHVRYPHTATHILETLELILDEWEIRDKVYTITTDNGANVKKAIGDMEEVKWLGCVAHTLHLVIGKGMIPAQVLIMRAKRLIDFFMRPKQSERLEEIQKRFPDLGNNEIDDDERYETNKQNNDVDNDEIRELLENNPKLDVGKTTDYLHAISDVSTRWNSSFLAWKRLLKLKDYINVLISTLSTKTDLDSKKDYKRLKQIMLEEEEWDVIKDLIPILEPFAEATDYLGGNKYCTYSTMVPTLIEIINRLKPLTANGKKSASEINFKNQENVFDDQVLIEDEEGAVANPDQIRKLKINDPADTRNLVNRVKLTLYAAMNHYWNNLITPEALLPSLLDPRIKGLSFVTISQRSNAEELLNNVYEQEKQLSLSTTDNSSTHINLKERRRLSQKYSSIFTNFKKPIISETNEVTEYLALKEVNFECDPLMWWCGQQDQFPILSKIAKKYLTVYTCSTSSERLFSDASNLLTAKRTRMSPKLFKRIIFLKRNSIHVESIHHC